MELTRKRMVVCEDCKKSYSFKEPHKDGVYRVRCPFCEKVIFFRVNKK